MTKVKWRVWRSEMALSELLPRSVEQRHKRASPLAGRVGSKKIGVRWTRKHRLCMFRNRAKNLKCIVVKFDKI